jgi:hypothetical protein
VDQGVGLEVCVFVLLLFLPTIWSSKALSLVLVSCDVIGGSNWVPIRGVKEH